MPISLVWTPKYRGRVLADTYIKLELKRMFKNIAKWKGLTIVQWHIGDEHIHLYIIIPPKYSVAYVIQVLKTKTSTWLKENKAFSNRTAFGHEAIMYQH